MSDLTAIDILIDPDEHALSRAREVNARVLKSMPGWVLDHTHMPHITVGVAKFDDLKVIEAEPFEAFPVTPTSVSVYHLGNNGTARKLLKTWPQ
jgi:hypothetical protein